MKLDRAFGAQLLGPISRTEGEQIKEYMRKWGIKFTWLGVKIDNSGLNAKVTHSRMPFTGWKKLS